MADKNQGFQVGRNVTVALDKDTITITMSAKAPSMVSASGKSEVVATTNGNVAVPGTDLKLGLNLYRPKGA